MAGDAVGSEEVGAEVGQYVGLVDVGDVLGASDTVMRSYVDCPMLWNMKRFWGPVAIPSSSFSASRSSLSSLTVTEVWFCTNTWFCSPIS